MFTNRTFWAILSAGIILGQGCAPPPRSSHPQPSAVSSATSGDTTSQPAASQARPASGGVVSMTLETAHESQERSARQLVEVFDSIHDDATAAAAAPKIKQLGTELGAGMKTFKATVAAFDLGGKKKEIEQFFEKLQENESAQVDLIGKLESLVNSPHGPQVQSGVNSLLDSMLEAATSGDRRGLEQVIQRKQLRR